MRQIILTAVVLCFFLAEQSEARCFRRRRCPCIQTPTNSAPLQTPPVATSMLTTPTGKVYRFYISDDVASLLEEEMEEKDSLRAFADSPRFTRSGDDYNGKVRRVAKLSFATGNLETYSTLNELIDTLQSDEEMRNHDPKLKLAPDFDRVDEEERNVIVDQSYLYAVAKEGDNDYHLILGNDPNEKNGKHLLTAEISALPKSGVMRDALKMPRAAYIDHFGSEPPSAFQVFESPIPVRVKGSLFFDNQHHPFKTNSPGPYPLKPDRVWEIHPIKSIEFLD